MQIEPRWKPKNSETSRYLRSEALTTVITFCVITPFSLAEFNCISEEQTAYIFKVEKEDKQETRKSKNKLCSSET
jgi:hypothetical protein